MGRIKKSSLKGGRMWCSRFDVHRKTRAASGHVAAEKETEVAFLAIGIADAAGWGINITLSTKLQR